MHGHREGAVELDAAPLDTGPAVHAGRRRTRLAIGSLTALACIGVGATVAITHHDPAATADDQPASDPTADDAQQLTMQTVRTLERTLDSHDRSGFLTAWKDTTAAQAQARQLYRNLRALRTDIDLAVSPTTPTTLQAGGGRGTARWEADVDVAWRLRAIDERAATTRMGVVLAETADGTRVVGVRRADLTRQPIWLMGSLTVRRAHGTLAAGTDADLVDLVDDALVRARTELAAAHVRSRAPLVAYVPPTQEDFEQMVQAYPGQYDHIAGINAPVDTSNTDASPQMIAINPDIFARLDARGRQVVVTHEATHYATGAARSSGPTWLVEGYADFVALSAERVPLAVSAAATLHELRVGGVPDGLPRTSDFSERDTGAQLDAYGLAHLAVRYIAAEYGRDRLNRFYTDVVTRREPLALALRRDLTTSVPALTRGWRTSLGELVDGA